MTVRKEKTERTAGENYRRKLQRYYTALEQASRSGAVPVAGIVITRLLDDCLDLPSPEREKAFVDGVLALSVHEDFQWMPKAA